MASKMDARLLKSTKFPPEFNQKVDMEKVNLPVMKKWIAKRIPEILGNEDDVLIELCCNLIEASRYPDIKSVQIQLTGFLDKDTAPFCKQLWNLLLSGQNSSQGVPKELLEAKKLELMQEKIDAHRANSNRDRELQVSKQGDRRDSRQTGNSWHAQGRRGDRAFGNRNRGGYDRAGQRSLSPRPRGRGARDSFGRDSYVPQKRRGHDQAPRRRRDRFPSDSPPRSRSRSRSMSSGNLRSPTPPRRKASPVRPQYSRKRGRSPQYGSHYRGRGYDARDRRYARGNSRSSSFERASPAPKRRRESRSRGSSVERRRRDYRSVSRTGQNRRGHRGRSRSRSRSRSLGRSSGRNTSRSLSRSRSSNRNSTRNRRGEPMAERRRVRRHGSVSGEESDYERGRGRERSRRRGYGGSRDGRRDPTRQRHNSSSESSPSPIRGQTADDLEYEPDTASEKPIVSIEKDDEEVCAS